MKILDRATQSARAPVGPAATEAAAGVVRVDAQESPNVALLERSIKESNDRLARLASALEAQHRDRAGLEQKFGQMEDRMRKLSSLTEMISAQYNPFVGEAPREEQPLPPPDAGFGAVRSRAAAEVTLMPSAPREAPLLDAPDGPAELERARPGYETSTLMLGWATMLVKHMQSRDAVVQVIAYYHSIGWLGEPACAQLMRYVDGIAATPRQPQKGEPDWRADADLHERSLLYLEKLKEIAAKEG